MKNLISQRFACGMFALAVVVFMGGPTVVQADEPSDGQKLFTAQKCNMCHAVPEVGVTAIMKSKKMQGPALPSETRDSDWIVSFLKREIQLNDKDHKKEFKGTDEELQAVAAWLISLESASE